MNEKIIDIKSSIFSITVKDNQEIIFLASDLPHLPKDEDKGMRGMFSGEYISISLLNYSLKSYILRYDPVPLGYEYIMEKYQLDEESASALTIAICNLIGRESKVPEKYEVKYRFALNRFKKIK